MIKISNLSKSYADNPVFSDFSLEIKKGEITCILGESGSGKTTLLNVLAGLTDYQGVVDCPEVSCVFQKPNLFPNLTMRQNLSLVNSNPSEIEKIAEQFEITDILDSYPKHVSGGQAQRVALCRGLLFDKETLLMDEPFSNLDIRLKYSLIDKVKQFQKEKSATMIVVTHDVKEAVSLANRVIVIYQGKVIYDNSKIQKKTEDEIFDLMKNYGQTTKSL